MIQFGGIPPQMMEQFGVVYEECKNHVGCSGCRLINGNPMMVGNGQLQSRIFCENGLQKENINNEEEIH